MNKKTTLILVNLGILTCLVLLAAGPLLASALAGSFASANSCQLDEGSVHPCVIGGIDYGEGLYTLGNLFWFSFFSVPTALILFFIYLLINAILWLIRVVRRRKENR